MPWERTGGFAADMFGFLNEDAEIRRAREENYDRAQADAHLQARLADPRWWETPESIRSELFDPIERKYESQEEKDVRLRREAALQEAALRNSSRTVSPGSTVIDPFTGEVIFENPAAAPRAQRHRIPLTEDSGLGDAQYIQLTADEVASRYDTLPQYAKDSEVVKLLMNRPRGSMIPQSPVSSAVPKRDGRFFMGDPNDERNPFRENPFRRGFESVAGSQTNAPTSGIKIRSIRVK